MSSALPFLPYSCPSLDAEDRAMILEVLESGYLSQGRYLSEFEQLFATSCDAEFAVAFATGTATLHGLMIASGVEAGDEVIIPALTFVGTSNAVLLTGATPVFVDIDPQTLCLDPNEVEKHISAKTKAILTVDFGGHPSDYEALRHLAQKHGVALFADAAHSNGALYKDRKIGSDLADMTAFSFNAVKNMTTAEGGMVTTNHASYYHRLKLSVNNGITRDHFEFESQGNWYYEQQLLSTNYKLNELQAALGISQLRKLAQFNARRRALAAFYTESLAHLPLILPFVAPNVESAFHIYPVQIREDAPIDRNTLFAHLQAEKLGVQVHYIPVVLHPYYRKLGYTTTQLPQTMAYYQRALSLPLHPSMTLEDAERVVNALRQYLA